MSQKTRKRTQQQNVNDMFHTEEHKFESEIFNDVAPTAPIHMHFNVPQSQQDKEETKVSTAGDRANIALLMFLYVLQGIPLGLAGSIPMILSSRKVTYKQQAMFSFAFWPFSVKLLWAPLVDSIYWSKIGRRKSWLVPTQYLIGVFMIVLSSQIPSLLGETADGSVNITTLTCVFFAMNFLAATQDIAVDGWALTMLRRENVGWASTCNTVGQTTGYFLGNVVFLALESTDFCNKYLRSVPQLTGLVTLADFTYFWGIIFFISTTLVFVFKKERDHPSCDNNQGVISTYKQLYRILKLPTVLSYIAILLTSKVGFAAADAVTGLKLIEAGMPKEKLALLAIPMVPIDIALPLIISKYTAGPRPMDVLLKAIPYRLVIGLWYAVLVYMAPSAKQAEGQFPYYFYVLILVSFGLHQVAVYSMFVAQMAFNAKISDPAIGGTYMTLLNTMSNLGGNWPSTMVLWLVDGLTSKSCVGGIASNSCSNTASVRECKELGGHCATYTDGYYIESVFCFIVGFLWLYFCKKKVERLQDKDLTDWKCPTSLS